MFGDLGNQALGLLCAEHIEQALCRYNRDFGVDFHQKIALDFGDVYRVMRAHGTDYCGRTMSRCRELLRSTEYGMVNMTPSFVEELPSSLSGKLKRCDSTFTFNKKEIPKWTLAR